MARRKLSTSQAVCIATLWVILCYMLLVYSETINLYTVFIIIASGIIVLVPIYKNLKRE